MRRLMRVIKKPNRLTVPIVIAVDYRTRAPFLCATHITVPAERL